MNAREKRHLANAAENSAAAEVWSASVNAHFAFLIANYGFRVTQVQNTRRFCQVVYQSNTTEIHIDWDSGQFQLSLMRLIRLVDRALPPPYPVLVTDDTRLLEFFVDDLLRMRAPHLIEERKRMERGGWSLKLLAQAVQSYAMDLLNGDSSGFESVEVFVNERREAHDKSQRKIEKESREVPEHLRWTFRQIARRTANFCDDYLDAESADICRRIAKELCHIPESPLISGRDATWTCAIVHAFCSVNNLFDVSHSPYVSTGKIAEYFRLSVTTMQGKSKQIRQLLKLSTKALKWLRRSTVIKSGA